MMDEDRIPEHFAKLGDRTPYVNVARHIKERKRNGRVVSPAMVRHDFAAWASARCSRAESHLPFPCCCCHTPPSCCRRSIGILRLSPRCCIPLPSSLPLSWLPSFSPRNLAANLPTPSQYTPSFLSNVLLPSRSPLLLHLTGSLPLPSYIPPRCCTPSLISISL